MGRNPKNWRKRKMIRRVACAVICILALAVVMCSKDKTKTGTDVKSVKIEVRLNGPVYQGTFYTGSLPATDLGIWIEDAWDSVYVKTVKMTQSIVSVSRYSHVEHLPAWKAASGITYEQLQAATGGEQGVAPMFDAVTQASPLFSGDSVKTVSVTWDLTDKSGAKVQPGVYKVHVEAANITKGDDAVVTIQAEHTSTYIDLSTARAQTAPMTAHILGVAVQFNLTDEPALGKHGAIVGPN
jgi:hypothetical protein